MPKKIAVIIIYISLMLASLNILKNKWVDLAPINSPYHKSICEYELGNQYMNAINQFGIKYDFIGVVLEENEACWNGPHAILYYMKSKGFVTQSLNDEILNKAYLKFIVFFSRDFDAPKKEGYDLVYRKKLNGNVKEYYLNIFQPKTKAKFNGDTFYIAGSKIISGNNSNLFNHGLIFESLSIPSFSNVTVSFQSNVLESVNGHRSYFLARTHTGGYDFDIFRYFDPSKEYININFDTNGFQDYVLYFGQFKNGSYKINGDIKINTKSLFLNEY
jgi:hypothetical protein